MHQHGVPRFVVRFVVVLSGEYWGGCCKLGDCDLMVGGFFKCGNDDFHATLPKVVTFTTWVFIVIYGGGLLLAASCASCLPSQVMEAYFIYNLVFSILWNYIIFWAAKTRNKCWLIAIACIEIGFGLDGLFGMWGWSAVALEQMFGGQFPTTTMKKTSLY